jgi:hypothetical protein
MKKIISAALAVLMIVSVLSVTAYAANNGPKKTEPAPYMIYYPGISFIETDGKGNIKIETDEKYGYEREAITPIFSDEGVSKLDGVNYDKSTNTLTLTNLNASDRILLYRAMGDDFKINVVGDCSLAQIRAYAYYWSSAVTFTGDGALTVNKDKLFSVGFENYSDGAESAVTFDKGVNVKISGKDKAVAVISSKAASADKVFVFNGDCKADVSSEESYTENPASANGYSLDKSRKPDYIGKKAKCLTDPDGIYVMGECTTTSSDGVEKKGYWINKLAYSKALGLYVLAPFSNGQTSKNIYPGDSDYNDYVQDEDLLYNTEKRYVDAHLKKMTDKNGKAYVYGDVWDKDETKVVATYSEISDVKGAYVFTAVKEGAEAEEFAKNLTPAPEDYVPIGNGVYVDASSITGVFVKELDMDSDDLGAPVKSKTDPDGVYFMTEGRRFENFGEANEKAIPSRWIRKYVYIKKHDIYIEDTDFADHGCLTMDYDDFDSSGYTLVNNDPNAGHVYNNGAVKNVYGYFYKDKNGKEYICTTNYDSQEGELTVYNYEEFPELKTSEEQKYICTPAEGVDGKSLTQVFTRKTIEGETNFYINNTDFESAGDGNSSSDSSKKANPVTVKTATKSVKAKALKGKKQTVTPITVKNNQGKFTVSLVKKGTAKKLLGKITVAKNGAVTIKKGKYSKGTYKIKLKISVKGNAAYASKTITKTAKIKIK